MTLQLATKRLHETVAQWLPDDQERHWVEPRLAGLLALEQMPAGSRDELFAAWRLFFERIAQSGPAVLVFEDIQWSDEGMLDFVARAARPIAQPAHLRRRADSAGAVRSPCRLGHRTCAA